MSTKKTAKRKSISFSKSTAQTLGLRFYLSENMCKGCSSKPVVRYVCNSNCVNCNRKRHKKKDNQGKAS